MSITGGCFSKLFETLSFKLHTDFIKPMMTSPKRAEALKGAGQDAYYMESHVFF